MNPPRGDDRQAEPTGTYASRIPATETFEEMDQVASTNDGFAPEAADKVPVILLIARPEFERALLAYGLLDQDSLARFLDKFPGGPPKDSLTLARALVQEGLLTRYQASATLQGKAKVLAIGPYLVLDRLGSGGMGLVFQAKQRETGDVVALKLLPPSASKQEQAVLRFRREAKIMSQLNHANLVSFRDIGEHSGVHYLVMDHVKGQDLHRLVRSDGPLGVRQAVDCLIQAARGLAAAHERGIVHRDIKPANLMIEPEGTVRVLDLGLARITHAADPLHSRESDTSLTHRGMIMGTVDFLPPEQSNDSKHADHRADVYSLGCTLHYLLTGRPPFTGETIMERLLAHHQKAVPSLVDFRPDVPRGLDAAFHRMLEKDPERRPQSMAEVIRIVEASLTEDSPFPADGRPILSSGRVPLDRNPNLSDLSGYEVITDSQSKIWKPLLDAASGEVESKPPLGSKPLGPASSTFRFWLGLLVTLAIVAMIGMTLSLTVSRFLRQFLGSGPEN